MDDNLKNFMGNMRSLQDEINRAGMGSSLEKLKRENANLRRQIDALRDGIKDIPININSGMSALFSLEIMYVNDAKFYLNRAMKFAKDAIAAADEIAKEMED